MKRFMLVILLVASIFQATVVAVAAQGPYPDPYRSYLYSSGAGYQSAWSNAQVAGQYYYNQISRDVATRWSNDKEVLEQRQVEAQELPGQARWYVNTASRYPGWPTR